MPDINDRTLDNGLRLITIRKDSQIMALNLGFKVGGLMDPPGKKGLSHFLEHMLFTGTAVRSHAELNQDLEYLGGEVNAFTDLAQLVITAAALNTEMEPAMELIAEIVRSPMFVGSELERERQVILSEYKEGLEDLETISFDLLYAKAWPKHPHIMDVIGDGNSIQAITLEDVEAHWAKWLSPANATLTMVSGRTHEEMHALAEEYFSSWQGRLPDPYDLTPVRNTPGEWQTDTDHSEMATVCFAWSFPRLEGRDRTALKVLNRRLGDSDNSLLFREVRLKRGLSYDIYSNLDVSSHVRTLEVYCATDPENVYEVAAIIESITSKIKTGEILFSTKDLELTHKMHRTNVAGLTDDTLALCTYVTANALEDLPLLNYENELIEMAEVTVTDLERLARMVFNEPTVSILVPTLY